jgi:hypothetical protein
VGKQRHYQNVKLKYRWEDDMKMYPKTYSWGLKWQEEYMGERVFEQGDECEIFIIV